MSYEEDIEMWKEARKTTKSLKTLKMMEEWKEKYYRVYKELEKEKES